MGIVLLSEEAAELAHCLSEVATRSWPDAPP